MVAGTPVFSDRTEFSVFTGGIEGGISGDSARRQHVDEPTVDQSTIWVDSTKKGPMLRQVRGMGTIVRAEGSTNLVASVTLPAFMTIDVRPNQNASIGTRKGRIIRSPIRAMVLPDQGGRATCCMDDLRLLGSFCGAQV